MRRLKTLVNLVILAIAAVIVWLEYQRLAEQRAREAGPATAPAGRDGGAATAAGRAGSDDPLASVIETVRNVAAQVATAATEITGLGPAETASEEADGDAAPPAPSPVSDQGATGPAASTSGATQQGGTTTANATDQAEDPTLPANAVRGDGSNVCPEAYPIKGNASSMIYHLPGTGSFERTVPEFCFATIEAAEAAGFRPPRH